MLVGGSKTCFKDVDEAVRVIDLYNKNAVEIPFELVGCLLPQRASDTDLNTRLEFRLKFGQSIYFDIDI
jgi:hypothetical protein